MAAGHLYVAVRETHSGVVFFVGDRAYKMKKPVDLGFLDFTTLEARRRNGGCRRSSARAHPSRTTCAVSPGSSPPSIPAPRVVRRSRTRDAATLYGTDG